MQLRHGEKLFTSLKQAEELARTVSSVAPTLPATAGGLEPASQKRITILF